MKNLYSEYRRIINFFESDSFGASSFFFNAILNDRFLELDKKVFKNASKRAKQKVKEIKSEYPQFWKIIVPMALIINPRILYIQLLTEDEINKAKQGIEKRINKYKSKGKTKEKRPSFLNKYYPESEEEISSLNAILISRNLNHNSDTLFHFWGKT